MTTPVAIDTRGLEQAQDMVCMIRIGERIVKGVDREAAGSVQVWEAVQARHGWIFCGTSEAEQCLQPPAPFLATTLVRYTPGPFHSVSSLRTGRLRLRRLETSWVA